MNVFCSVDVAQGNLCQTWGKGTFLALTGVLELGRDDFEFLCHKLDINTTQPTSWQINK